MTYSPPDSLASVIYRTIFKLGLRRLSPEAAHGLAFGALDPLTARPRQRAWLRRLTQPDDELIRVHALGFVFPSPLGVAAGLDKDALHVEGLGALGFGFVEAGTVTPRPQGSNPPPIIARLIRDRALINRMGFPSAGGEAVAARLRSRAGETIVGVNIGKNRDTPIENAAADYRAAARLVAPHADYLVLNVSSPNTPGLRALEAVAMLRPLIDAVQTELKSLVVCPPLLVKISPDLGDEQVDAIADLAVELELAGIIATNTTVRRADLITPATEVAALSWPQGGGVSGPPLRARSLAVLRRLYARVGRRLVLISVGGVESADDVWQRVLAGATLVQAYTGFVYGGPAWPRQVNFELAHRVWASGANSIADLVGSEAEGPPGAPAA